MGQWKEQSFESLLSRERRTGTKCLSANCEHGIVGDVLMSVPSVISALVAPGRARFLHARVLVLQEQRRLGPGPGAVGVVQAQHLRAQPSSPRRPVSGAQELK